MYRLKAKKIFKNICIGIKKNTKFIVQSLDISNCPTIKGQSYSCNDKPHTYYYNKLCDILYHRKKMSLQGKLISEINIKCNGDVFHEIIK